MTGKPPHDDWFLRLTRAQLEQFIGTNDEIPDDGFPPLTPEQLERFLAMGDDDMHPASTEGVWERWRRLEKIAGDAVARGATWSDVPPDLRDTPHFRHIFICAYARGQKLLRLAASNSASRAGRVSAGDRKQRKEEREEYWRHLAMEMITINPAISKSTIVDAILTGWTDADGSTEDRVDANAISRCFSIRSLKKRIAAK